MGAPVVSLSLSPAMDMLATAHVNRRGIYVWANQLVFDIGSIITPSEDPVRVRSQTGYDEHSHKQEGQGMRPDPVRVRVRVWVRVRVRVGVGVNAAKLLLVTAGSMRRLASSLELPEKLNQ